MRRPLLNHTRRGESVYDPFLGSGTTLAAAEITERVCYGIELDEKYVDTVILRWQGLTGGKAILEADGRRSWFSINCVAIHIFSAGWSVCAHKHQRWQRPPALSAQSCTQTGWRV
jgi:hypothetical protein